MIDSMRTRRHEIAVQRSNTTLRTTELDLQQVECVVAIAEERDDGPDGRMGGDAE